MSMAVIQVIGNRGNDRLGGKKLEFIDVSRAYCHAKARRLVYVKSPEKDYEEGMWKANQSNAWYTLCSPH